MPVDTRSFTDSQIAVFRDRYALRSHEDQQTVVEQAPPEMWARVAKWAAQKEKERASWERNFYEILEDFKFVPGGRVLNSAGAGAEVTSGNCFVLPSPEDSRRGIIASLADWTETLARGGGVGIDISTLRPSGDFVKGVNGRSSGPVAWMDMFSTAVQVTTQGGSRRGASLICINDSHPDVMEFIKVKKTPGVLEGANLSVKLSDKFMHAVEQDQPWDLHWGGAVYRTIEAKELWGALIEAAWASGEPGCLWTERYNKERNCWYLPDQEAVAHNACSEQPLPPYGVCLLGTVNVERFCSGKSVDWDEFKRTTWRAVRFLDNVIDLSSYPLPENAEQQQRIRRVGIGITGLADALIKMELVYGSSKAISFTEDVYRTLCEEAYRESLRLARERGPFPACDNEKHAQAALIKRLPGDIQEGVARYGIRNGYLTSQQPSGTGSILAGVNSGIEPVFDFNALRADRLGTRKVKSEAASLFAQYSNGNKPPAWFVGANDVPPRGHVLMQAAAQRWNDSAISKTVNAPHDFTIEDTDKLFRFAYSQGLRTIAFYRDRSRDAQVLYHAAEKGQQLAGRAKSVRVRLPVERKSITHRFQVGEQEGYVTVGLYDDGRPGELFITMSKEGSTTRGLMDAFATCISIALQHGVKMEYLTEKFSGSKFEPAGLTGNEAIPSASSIIDYIFRWLRLRFHEGAADTVVRTGHLCPMCGDMMVKAEGCEHCEHCGYQKCG